MEKKKFLEKIASSNGIEKFHAYMDYSVYLRQVDPLESVNQAKAALALANQANDEGLKIKAYTYICTACFYNSDFENIKFWSQKLLKSGQKLNDEKAIGDAYNMQARMAYQKDDRTQAHKLLLKALDHYLKTRSNSQMISCYNALGIIHLDKGEMDEAEYYMKQALNAAIEADSPSQHSIRLNLSNILYEQGRYEDTLKCNQEILDYYRENEMNSMAATALNNIGLCYFYRQEFEKACLYFQDAMAQYKSLNQKLDLCHASCLLCTTYIKIGEFDKCWELLQDTHKLAIDNNFERDILNVYQTFADYYKAQEDYKSALEYLEKKYDLKQELEKKDRQTQIQKLESQYKTRIYKLTNAELSEKNKAMLEQIKQLNASQSKLQDTYLKLQKEFEKVTAQLNDKDDFLSAQVRMNLMGEMISAIAHQWKQPLNVIWVLTQAIGDAWEYDELSDDFLNNQISNIGTQIKYMSETIDDFRNFFRKGEIRDFPVRQAIDKSLKIVSYLIQKNGIKLETKINKECKLNGNPNELSQVIINILNNARQAIETAEIIDPVIKLMLDCDHQGVDIKIFNTGSSIPPRILKRIFEPYFTSNKKDGTGLGLHICRQIIEDKFNGHIYAENCDGGVQFTIKIPFQQ